MVSGRKILSQFFWLQLVLGVHDRNNHAENGTILLWEFFTPSAMCLSELSECKDESRFPITLPHFPCAFSYPVFALSHLWWISRWIFYFRYDLNPLSPFPTSTYSNFAAYYTSKYDATITTVKQPLLDVDFTVMRLSLIVPRYVNIRGHHLPCSTEARKRDRRENLTHKQILIPELCFRHPFPASGTFFYFLVLT